MHTEHRSVYLLKIHLYYNIVWQFTLQSVGRSVCHTSEPCKKTAEPIEMPFGLWTRVGPRNHVLDGGQDRPIGKGQF